MSVEEDLERRLENWARWYWGGSKGSVGTSSIYCQGARPRRYGEAPMPIINGEAVETDTAIHQLIAELQTALRARYLRLAEAGHSKTLYEIRTMSEVQVAAALYVSYDTYLRRLQRARTALRAQLQAARIAAVYR